jgi:hypothetical protein
MHYYTSGDCRVCKVAAKSAEEAFYDYDRNEGTYNCLPDRKGGRNVHCKEKTGNYCGEITDGGAAAAKFGEKEFEAYAGSYANCAKDSCLKSENCATGNCCGHKSNANVKHDVESGSFSVNVRRYGNNKIIFHYLFSSSFFFCSASLVW